MSFPHELQKQHGEHHCGLFPKEKDDAAKITAAQFIIVLALISKTPGSADLKLLTPFQQLPQQFQLSFYI